MTDYEMIFLCKLGAALIAYFISLGLAYHLGKLRVLYIWQKADEDEEAAREAEEDEMLQDMERDWLSNRVKWYEQFNEEDFDDGDEE